MDKEPQLYTAAANANIVAARDLLQRGVEIDARAHDHTGSTPLTWAVSKRNNNATAFLLGLGCDPNAVGMFQMSPLELAITNRDEHMVDLLLRHRADPNKRERDLARTPMHAAADTLLDPPVVCRIVRALHAQGADLNVPDAVGQTPLHVAAEADNLPVARTLLALGAEVDSTDDSGYTPAVIAAENGFAEMLDLLLSHGADL